MAAAALAVVLPVGAASATTTNDPAENIAPSPSYWSLCIDQGRDSQACTDTIVQAINHARSLEGVGPMTLPADFGTLTTAQQTFVVSNLERVDRGLPPVAGMVDSLNSLATTAAAADADPYLPSWNVDSFSVDGWSSIWAGDLNALAADYDWMYNDGWSPFGSINGDCQTADARGCWGHRHAILRSGTGLITGVAAEEQPRWTSIAQILVSGSGAYPAFTYSWADVTGTPTVPAAVQPLVTVNAWPVSSTRHTVDVSVDPAMGQPVRLRRHSTDGWRTVRRTTATADITFDSVRGGAYRVVVNATAASLRTVTRFRLS